MTKRIALSQRLIKNDCYPETREALDVRWGQALSNSGFIPLPIGIQSNWQQSLSELKVDGILLTGGNSLGSISGDSLDLERDSLERGLLEFAVLHNLPVLGVCRGCQFLADYFGAHLKSKNGHAGTRHSLRWVNGPAHLSKDVDLPSEVNSYHSFCIADLPDCTQTLAFCPDNMVEAFEHLNNKIMGIMWHPEREHVCENQMELLNSFFGD